jgi:hypothetical protein
LSPGSSIISLIKIKLSIDSGLCSVEGIVLLSSSSARHLELGLDSRSTDAAGWEFSPEPRARGDPIADASGKKFLLEVMNAIF